MMCINVLIRSPMLALRVLCFLCVTQRTSAKLSQAEPETSKIHVFIIESQRTRMIHDSGAICNKGSRKIFSLVRIVFSSMNR